MADNGKLRAFLFSLAVGLLGFTAMPAAAAAPGGSGDRAAAESALARVKDLRHGIGVSTGRELTPALRQLARRRQALDASGRREADALLARPTEGNADPQNDGYSVPQAPPDCGTRFCVHYVTSTADAPSLTDTTPANGIPDYVDMTLSVFENEVFPCENGSAPLGCTQAGSTGLGWPQPPSDLTETPDNGGDGRFDVYLVDLGTQIYGYAATDPQPSAPTLYSYMVLDNDYAGFGYPDPAVPLEVTAAHEYNHVLQYGIDPNEDTWMFESTATWAEEQVYPAIDDYLNYMPTWVASTADPLTDANGGGGIKIYGSAVWNHFIDARHGAGTILDAWEASTNVNGGPFAPASYGTAIAANGGAGFSEEFDDFSAAVAEWNAPGSGFPDPYPDVPRGGSLTAGAAATTVQLDHTTFALRDVAVPTSPSTLTLTATLPAGLKGAIALVGRSGGLSTGTVTTRIQRVSSGGAASVSLPNAAGLARITAVFVNSDPAQSGWAGQDWKFTKDNESFTNVQVTSSTAPPAPAVTTGAATSVAATGATLNGTVNPNGSSTTYWFEFGETAAYGNETAHASAGSGSSPVAESAALAGLTPGTSYHYRVVAQNAGGTTPGGDRTFTTPAPPVATTQPPAETASTSTTTAAGAETTTLPSGSVALPAKELLLTASVVRGRLASVLRKGLHVRTRCDHACVVVVRVVISKKLARRLGLKTVVGVASGTGSETVRFRKAARRALARLRSVPLSATVSAHDSSGATAALSRKVTLRR